ncbi:MAG: serine/threonine-protein phosphatase [Phycisphaeraceae bacterium]|nr:serine/threonine-protein phosphatase [Phycisphaeraceae bacterium]
MPTKILLIGSSDSVLRVPMVEAVLAHWPDKDQPPVTSITFDQVLEDETHLDRAAIAWVILDEHQPRGLYAVMSLLLDHHICAMISRPDESHQVGSLFQEGVVIAPLMESAATLCAVLRTLWGQATTVRHLRTEIKALQMHQGGLCDQIGKIDEELRLAAQLQREFLPSKLPKVGRVECRVFFRPASYVSGDIYEVLQLDEEHIGFFIADAVGHGVPAALMTMYIKRCLHTKEIDATAPRGYRIIPPNEALAKLNHDMVEQQTGKVRFATACYGVLNCKTLELAFARAGHPYPLILNENGGTRMLQPEGAMLGIFPDEIFELHETQLQSGDRLLLYSDGFEVAFPKVCPVNGRDSANQQYTEEFKHLAHGTLDEALERLIAKLDLQVGSLNQQDDLTVLCIGVQSVETELHRQHQMTLSDHVAV